MSAQQQNIDLLVKWVSRTIVGIASFLIMLFVNDMRADIKEMKTDIRSVMEKQASRDEKINALERVVFK
jgi:hypothetical protein